MARIFLFDPFMQEMLLQQLKVEEPTKRKGGVKVANVAELVSKLKNEAKVI